jgi:anti-anti-sigma factor
MTMATRLCESEQIASNLVLTLQHNLGELDFMQIEQEQKILCQQLEDDPSIQNVLVDFGRTTYFGSTTVSLLLMILKQVRVRHGRMALCNLSANENDVLEVTQINSVIPIYPSRQAALDAIQA